MLKQMTAALAVTLGLFATSAHAQEPIWTCGLNFNAAGGGVQLIIGHFELQGPGEVSCIDVAGHTETFPVTVKMGAQPIAPFAGIGMFKMSGAATGVGYLAAPSDIIGQYLTLDGSVAVGLGVGASIAFRAADQRALTLNVSVKTMTGLGADVGLNYFRIERR